MKITKALLAASIVVSGMLANPVAAQTIELTAKNSSSTVRGELVSARGGKIVLRTKIGVVTFDMDRVICSGAACPVTLSQNNDMTIAAPTELAGVIIPLLIDGFAESQEIEARLLSKDGLPIDFQGVAESKFQDSQAGDDYSFIVQMTGDDSEQVANIEVQSADGNHLFEMLAQGEASVILSDRPAGNSAVSATLKSGGGNLRDFNQERIVAVDGYVIVTHPSNKLRSLSLEQISDVISGKIDNWTTLGGPDHAINVYSFKPDTEAFRHIDDLILKPFEKNLTPNAQLIHSNRALTVAVENDRYSIGIVSYSSVRDTRPIAIENECGIVIEPTSFNIKTEEYPLQNRIIVYNRPDSSEISSQFVDYLSSPFLDDLVAKSGLISLSIKHENSAETRDRLLAAVESSSPQVSSTSLQRFVLNVMKTERLSTTLRFATGSTTLDNKARRDLARVLQYVDDTAPKRVIFAGFADSRGGFSTNLNLSKSRAQSVLSQIKAADVTGLLKDVEIEVHGYGELGPVACNETFDGRATNRRVEIWVE